MLINKNCYLCKGSGKVKNEYGEFACPECEFRDLYEKALCLKLDKFYDYDEDDKEEYERMAIVFREPTVWSKWHIVLYKGNIVRRVDWSWMNE